MSLLTFTEWSKREENASPWLGSPFYSNLWIAIVLKLRVSRHLSSGEKVLLPACFNLCTGIESEKSLWNGCSSSEEVKKLGVVQIWNVGGDDMFDFQILSIFLPFLVDIVVFQVYFHSSCSFSLLRLLFVMRWFESTFIIIWLHWLHFSLKNVFCLLNFV